MAFNFANTPVKVDSNGYLLVTTSGAATGFGNGTVNAPSIFFLSQTTTGLYLNAANDMRLTIAGVDESRWFQNGQMWRSDAVIGFATSGVLTSFDTAFSRATAGTVALGTGGAGGTGGTLALTSIAMAGKATFYNGVAVTGQGFPSIYGAQRVTSQTTAGAFVSYTTGAADESLEISANVLVTTHGSEAITIACAYTDEGGTARVATLAFASLAGAVAPTVGAAGPFFGQGIHIRAKQTTAVSVASTGTFTGATFNADGIIRKLA